MLSEQGYQVIGAGRTPPSDQIRQYFTDFICCDLNQIEISPKFLQGIDSIINLAALAHNAKKGDKDFESAYLETNAFMPQRLARACVEAGVQKFIHLSSVKVAGEVSAPGKPFDESNVCSVPPKGIYGRSKWEAERLLTSTLANSNTQLIILRPPLIYGPKAKGTLFQLICLIERGFPLPLKSSQAKRSFLSVSNLCSAILTLLQDTNKDSGAYFLSDGPSIPVPQLVEVIARELGLKNSLISCPAGWFKTLASISGKSQIYEKLFLNLEVKSDKFRKDFSWTPSQSFEEGIREMVIARLQKITS
jgi:UDP-glucose 4-epimerase